VLSYIAYVGDADRERPISALFIFNPPAGYIDMYAEIAKANRRGLRGVSTSGFNFPVSVEIRTFSLFYGNDGSLIRNLVGRWDAFYDG
jgi:hypothetical protein